MRAETAETEETATEDKLPKFADLGRALRAAREARGLSTVQLAARTGIGQAHVCRAESGHRCPTLATLVRYAKALGPLVALPLPEGGAVTVSADKSPAGETLSILQP